MKEWFPDQPARLLILVLFYLIQFRLALLLGKGQQRFPDAVSLTRPEGKRGDSDFKEGMILLQNINASISQDL